jgi:hypothetical protein
MSGFEGDHVRDVEAIGVQYLIHGDLRRPTKGLLWCNAEIPDLLRCADPINFTRFPNRINMWMLCQR